MLLLCVLSAFWSVVFLVGTTVTLCTRFFGSLSSAMLRFCLRNFCKLGLLMLYVNVLSMLCFGFRPAGPK